MSFSIPLAALLALSTTAQSPETSKMTAAAATFVGDEVAVAVHVNLARWDVATSSRRLVGKLADDAEVAGILKLADGWVDALKKAGATDVYLLADLGDMPGYPLVVVPLAGGNDGRGIAKVFSEGGPMRWPASEVIRGAVVAGTPEALARVKDARKAARPEFTAAMAAGGDSTIHLAIIPSPTQRRSMEEALPTLPAEFGGAAITTLTRGMSWASIALSIEPKPTLRLVVQGKDAEASKSLLKLAGDGLGQLAKASRANPAIADLADAIAAMKPEAKGDQVTLEADLDKTAALVAVPVRQAREAAMRSQCVNNLKQIALAMHNYHSANNAFPPAFVASKDGKPLLSWRVLILPYVDQKELFDQFHLDEAWDSPHNKPLIAKMPKVYTCPSGSKAVAGEWKTTYLTPRGPGTIFPGARAIGLKDITDGTSNTIFTVDAGDNLAVIWTKPDDWEVGPEATIAKLMGHHPGGTDGGFADGSVRFFKETIAPKVLQALLTREGGEVISSDDF